MVHTCTKFYPNGIFALGDDYRYIPASVDAYIHARASRSTTQKIVYYGRAKALTRGFRYSFCYALYDTKEPILDEYGNESGEYEVRYHKPERSKA